LSELPSLIINTSNSVKVCCKTLSRVSGRYFIELYAGITTETFGIFSTFGDFDNYKFSIPIRRF
jgi:hypothetical protein